MEKIQPWELVESSYMDSLNCVQHLIRQFKREPIILNHSELKPPCASNRKTEEMAKHSICNFLSVNCAKIGEQ